MVVHRSERLQKRDRLRVGLYPLAGSVRLVDGRLTLATDRHHISALIDEVEDEF